ncbi:MAG: hypothetical protein ACI8PP_003353 [Candidatus Pseudothioglobus sp.]|jgi:hypothetical protein
MTTSQTSEYRGETRIELEETVFIEVIASTHGAPGNVVICNSLDFSANGLQVVVDDDIAAGSIFRLCIDLQDQDPIFLVAEVKWKRPDTSTDGFRLGFLLFESDDTDIDRWHALVGELIDAGADSSV